MRRDPEADPIARWARGQSGAALWLQASAVAVDGNGLLILGASGSGKSSLAVELMALGALMISDDGVWLDTAADPARLERPDTAPDLIEVRHVGLIRAGATLAAAPLALAVDLDRAETDRLPPFRSIALGDRRVPLLHAAGQHRLAPALIVMLRHGRAEP